MEFKTWVLCSYRVPDLPFFAPAVPSWNCFQPKFLFFLFFCFLGHEQLLVDAEKTQHLWLWITDQAGYVWFLFWLVKRDATSWKRAKYRVSTAHMMTWNCRKGKAVLVEILISLQSSKEPWLRIYQDSLSFLLFILCNISQLFWNIFKNLLVTSVSLHGKVLSDNDKIN